MKKETIEEAAERFIQESTYRNITFEDYIKFGANWQAQRTYSEEEVLTFLNAMISEIEIRKQNIISNSGKMEVHLLEGGCIAFESSQDVIKETFEQFKKK
jgi:hypothetical protein